VKTTTDGRCFTAQRDLGGAEIHQQSVKSWYDVFNSVLPGATCVTVSPLDGDDARGEELHVTLLVTKVPTFCAGPTA
jgi:hypothetical protein